MSDALSLGYSSNLAYRAKSAADRIQTRMSKSIEGLSSGRRINHAADDPSGQAIAGLLRGQIRGSQQASQNVQDAVSLLQVGDAGLEGTNDMLRRLRSLSLQAANDTLTDTDRGNIQKEADQLLAEIDRMAAAVNFNNKNLLTGEYNGAAGATQTFDSSGTVAADNRPNYYAMNLVDPTAVAPGAGLMAEFTNAQYNLASSSEGFTFTDTCGTAGERDVMRFQFASGVINPSLVSSIGFQLDAGSSVNGVTPDTIVMQLYDFQNSQWVTVGTNTTGSIPGTTDFTYSVSTDAERFVDSNGDIWAQAYTQTAAAGGGNQSQLRIDYASLSVSERGEGLVIQAGANQDDTFEVFLPDASASGLGVAGLSLASRTSAENAITTLDTAMKQVDGARTRIGAFMNRLFIAGDAAGIKILNESDYLSQTEDLEYSNAVLEFTKDQILAQTAQSALAQANFSSGAILQLLNS